MNRSFVWLTVVAGLIVNTSSALAHDFTWDNLAFASIKLNPEFDIDANLDWYIEAFRPDVWKRYRNDEFVFREKRAESRELLKQRIAQFDINEPFTIRGNVRIGAYDFEKQEFPTDPSGSTAYWHEYGYKYSDVLPSDMKVFFLNHEFLRAIPMDQNAAKNLVAARKNSYGEIDRTIYVNIEMRIVKLERPGELKAEALNVTYFSDNLRSRALGPKLIWTQSNADGDLNHPVANSSDSLPANKDRNIVANP